MKGHEKEINAKVRRMRKILGKEETFTGTKLQLLDLYRAGIYAGIKIMSSKR